MKKRVLSLLLTLSMLLNLPGVAFANDVRITGYSYLNPTPFNTEMKIKDVKTKNGSWKNVGIKVSEMKVDNAGYQGALLTNGQKANSENTKKFDALKVKVTYTFSGFTGNANSLIKDNMVATKIMATQANEDVKNQESGQLYAKFPYALNNIIEKYSLGGKVYKGAWYEKKIKDVNFSKATIMSGYVYVIVEKGQTLNVSANFQLSPQKNSDLNNVYLAMTKEVTVSKIKETGSYTYGNSDIGTFNTTFELKQGKAETETDLKYYYNDGDNMLMSVSIVTTDISNFSAKENEEKMTQWIQTMSTGFDLESKKEANIGSIVGLSNKVNRYVNSHVINNGKKLILIMVVSAVTEKTKADQLWESYKASNDLSPKENTGSQPSTPKTTSTEETGNFVYGTSQYGMFSSSEELIDRQASNPETLKYKSKSGDSWYTLQFFAPNKQSLENLDTNIKKMVPNAEIGKLDQDNITVYTDNSNPRDCITILSIVKNNLIYTFIIEMPIRKLSTQKVLVIKSYLISLGYTEDQAETMATSAIFK